MSRQSPKFGLAGVKALIEPAVLGGLQLPPSHAALHPHDLGCRCEGQRLGHEARWRCHLGETDKALDRRIGDVPGRAAQRLQSRRPWRGRTGMEPAIHFGTEAGVARSEVLRPVIALPVFAAPRAHAAPCAATLFEHADDDAGQLQRRCAGEPGNARAYYRKMQGFHAMRINRTARSSAPDQGTLAPHNWDVYCGQTQRPGQAHRLGLGPQVATPRSVAA